MNKFLIEAIAYMAAAQAGADKLTNDLRERAKYKWQKSKSLPRKKKKALRKDAVLDWEFSNLNESTSKQLFNLF